MEVPRMVFGPRGVGHVLHERHAIYHKDNADYRLLKPVLVEGLVTSNGDLWLRQRRLVQPAFHRRRVAGFAPMMASHATAMLRWETVAPDAPLDVAAAEMMRLTLEIATSALFGVDPGGSADVIRESFTIVNRRVGDVFGRPWLMLPGTRVPTRANRRAWRAKARLDAVVAATIAERRRRGDD